MFKIYHIAFFSMRNQDRQMGYIETFDQPCYLNHSRTIQEAETRMDLVTLESEKSRFHFL